MRTLMLVFVLSIAALAAPPAAAAQAPVAIGAAVTTADTPVYIRAERLPTPLRVLPRGTRMRALQVRDGWVQVSFDDPQWGDRFGWVEERLVRIDRTATAAPAPRVPPVAPGDARRAPLGSEPEPRTASPAAQPAAPVAGPGVRLLGSASFMRMTAADSFEAVTGSSNLWHYGGGVQGINLWKGLFVEGTFEYAATDGERVFVFEDEAFPLGIPVDITTTPIDVVAGWRFVSRSAVTPYVGGGYSNVGYKETSPFAGEGDDVDERYHGYVVMGGVEVRASRWIHVRGEARYREVPDGLGEGGASAIFDETSLGGFGVSVKVAIGK